MDSTVSSCLNILRRTPPCDTEQNLKGLMELLQSNNSTNKNNSQIQELLQRVDPPLQISHDPNDDNKPFLICDHNREDTSHRSPWTNHYYPIETEHMVKPNPELRALEMQANEVLEVYRDLYFGKQTNLEKDQLVSSVYLWDTPTSSSIEQTPTHSNTLLNGFAAIFLLSKRLPAQTGFWNSIHVMDISPMSSTSTCTYKLTTTLLISMDPSSSLSSSSHNTTNMSASINRKLEQTHTVDKYHPNHLEHMGKLLEQNEQFLRVKLESLYLGKTQELLQNIRPGGMEWDYESSHKSEPAAINTDTNIDTDTDSSVSVDTRKKMMSKFSKMNVSVRGGNAMHASLLSQAILKRASQNDD